MVAEVPDEGLSPVEQALADHVRRGEWLDLTVEGETVDEATMRSWDASRTCRAWVIRHILRGRLAPDPDPHGLRLRGARITGRLDLQDLTTDVNLELENCLLEEGVVTQGARMASLSLTGCQLEHPAEPPLDAERLTCSVLLLSGARVTAHAGAGAVNLVGAHIAGRLVCTSVMLVNNSGPALIAEGLRVGQGMYLTGGFTGSGSAGAVRLSGADIADQFGCANAELRNDSGPALTAESLQVGQDMLLRGGFVASGSSDGGAVRLTGAHIGGQFSCTGARLHNDSGPALDAEGLQVGQDMLLEGGFVASGSSDGGAVRLSGAHIGGLLSCTNEVLLVNVSGPALVADTLHVGQAMLLRGLFTAEGRGRTGTVRLGGAHIGGQFVCAGAVLRNDSGPALDAEGLQVGLDMRLQLGFAASGSGKAGAVYLVGARIGGQLDCTGAWLHNESGPALVADRLQVGQGMYLTGAFTGGGGSVAVDLTGVRVGGTFRFAPTRLEHNITPHALLAVDGLTYSGVPELISARDWRDLLRDGTLRYAAQPYQQLAAGCRALGDERQARETLMAQRQDQLDRTHTRWPERRWGQITKVTLGYGYQPWRALVFLAVVAAVSCVLTVVLGSHGALAQTSKTATPNLSCTVVQQVSVGLDLNLPVGTSGVARAQCDLTPYSASVTAAWLSAVGWLLRILAWVFAALFIAGFTSAVRKT